MNTNSKLSSPISVLLSGGLDSAGCLAYYLQNEKAVTNTLFIDYGQIAAKHELKAAEQISQYYNISLNKISVSGMGVFKDGFINGRNAFLLLTALTAFKYPFGLISIGIHAGTNYSDCTQDFIEKLQNLFNLYCDGKITIDAPFVQWSKPEIWEFCLKNTVPIDLTYSCEAGTNPVCGKCLSCKDIRQLYGIKQYSC